MSRDWEGIDDGWDRDGVFEFIDVTHRISLVHGNMYPFFCAEIDSLLLRLE
jgi:hypothetical protein